MLDPRQAHTLPTPTLHGLLGNFHGDLHDIRTEFARALTRPDLRTLATWQDAWNAWTHATPHQPGTLTYRPSRCPDCHGRGHTHRNAARNLARTGHPYVCGTCMGANRHSTQNIRARYATGGTA